MVIIRLFLFYKKNKKQSIFQHFTWMYIKKIVTNPYSVYTLSKQHSAETQDKLKKSLTTQFKFVKQHEFTLNENGEIFSDLMQLLI